MAKKISETLQHGIESVINGIEVIMQDEPNADKLQRYFNNIILHLKVARNMLSYYVEYEDLREKKIMILRRGRLAIATEEEKYEALINKIPNTKVQEILPEVAGVLGGYNNDE